MHSCLQQAQRGIEDAVRGMTTEQMTRHPEGKWSAVEVLEHLSIAFAGTARGLQRCLDSGSASVTPRKLWQVLGKVLIVDIGYFPAGRKAPEFTQPTGKPAAQVCTEIFANLAAMNEVLDRCEQKFGPSVKLANHPVLGAFSVRDWRRFHRTHTLHHMKQIAALRRGASSSPAAHTQEAGGR